MTKKNPHSNMEQELYKVHADMCKVFSHATRLAILNTLREEEMSVSEIAERLNVSVGNLSQHLNMMKQRRVLASRKDGNNVYYRLANPKMLKAFDLIREILFEQMRRESIVVRHLERTYGRR